MTSSNAITRRQFIKGAGIAGASVAALGVLGGCSGSPFDEAVTGMRTVIDDTGRQVRIPVARKISKIYFTSALAQVFCFTIAPDLLAGTALHFTKRQIDFLPFGSEDLSYLGTLAGGGYIDMEALKLQGVQLIFSISGTAITDVNVADALALERESGIPVFMFNGSLDQIGNTYRMLGDLLDRQERGQQLADYCESIYARVSEAIARVPKDKRVRYYFAEGPEGLQTEPDTSEHSLVFSAAGGINVAADAPLTPGHSDLADVTLDQVRAWDPQYIIAWDWETRGGAADYISVAQDWAGISAVKTGNVYAMPSVPFPFCDRPPGANRLLGIQWLANLFYPDYYDIDMVEAVRDFYSKCYWRTISRDQAAKILGLEEW